MSFTDDVKNGNYELRGSVLAQSSTTTTDNLHALTSIDGFTGKFNMTFNGSPVLLMGLQMPASVGSFAQPLAISAHLTTDYDVAIRTDNQGAVISYNAPDNVSVGAASTSIIAANPLRRAIILCNHDSVKTVDLNLAGAAALINKGLRLNPGQTMIMVQGDGSFTTAEIRGIASAASAEVGIQEGV